MRRCTTRPVLHERGPCNVTELRRNRDEYTLCPRPCSECKGARHHWLEPEQFVPMHMADGMMDLLDPEQTIIVERCKHCPELRAFNPDEDEIL